MRHTGVARHGEAWALSETPATIEDSTDETIRRVGSTVTVLSLVERGWPAARRVTIELTRVGAIVRHVVRGTIPDELREMLTPYQGMTISGVTPRWYRWRVWLILLRQAWRRRPLLVLVDHERAARWVARWFPALRHRLFLVHETADGMLRIVQDGSAIDPRDLWVAATQ